MNADIQIVDEGRGLQLSTCRIRVQDLVPYFQKHYSYEDILLRIPTLSHEEIAVVEQYYREHQAELDEEDRQIRERNAQRKNPPEIEEIIRRGEKKMAWLREEFKKVRGEKDMAALRERLKKKNAKERNGAHASG